MEQRLVDARRETEDARRASQAIVGDLDAQKRELSSLAKHGTAHEPRHTQIRRLFTKAPPLFPPTLTLESSSSSSSSSSRSRSRSTVHKQAAAGRFEARGGGSARVVLAVRLGTRRGGPLEAPRRLRDLGAARPA